MPDARRYMPSSERFCGTDLQLELLGQHAGDLDRLNVRQSPRFAAPLAQPLLEEHQTPVGQQ